MTITYSLEHVSGTTESTLVQPPVRSEMTLVSTYTDKDGGAVAKYVLASGDNAFPAFVTFMTSLQNKNGVRVRRIEVKLESWALKENSVDSSQVRAPIQGSIVLILPALMTIEVGDLAEFVGNLFGYTYPSISSGARSTSWLQTLLYGSPKVS